MRHLARDAHLVAETGESGFAGVAGRGKEFESDRLIEDQIVGAVDFAHAAAAQEADNAIAAGEHGAGRKAAFIDTRGRGVAMNGHSGGGRKRGPRRQVLSAREAEAAVVRGLRRAGRAAHGALRGKSTYSITDRDK